MAKTTGYYFTKVCKENLGKISLKSNLDVFCMVYLGNEELQTEMSFLEFINRILR